MKNISAIIYPGKQAIITAKKRFKKLGGIQPTEKKKRNSEIVRLYKTGEFTLTALGNRYGLTRERIRQIFKKNNFLGEKLLKKIVEQRILKKIEKKYGSLDKYAEFLEKKEERRLLRKERKNKWNLKYDNCVDCGTTDAINNPHKGKGRCGKCYVKYRYNNDINFRFRRKEAEKKWRENNLEKVRIGRRKYARKNYLKNKEKIKKYNNLPWIKTRRLLYMREYSKLPHVKARKAEYLKRPGVMKRLKEKQKEYSRKYYLKNKENIKILRRIKYE